MINQSLDVRRNLEDAKSGLKRDVRNLVHRWWERRLGSRSREEAGTVAEIRVCSVVLGTWTQDNLQHVQAVCTRHNVRVSKRTHTF